METESGEKTALGFFVSEEIPNSKHQIPNKYKIQKPKDRKGQKQAPQRFGFCISAFGIVWNLVLEIWNFRAAAFGAWNLEFPPPEHAC